MGEFGREILPPESTESPASSPPGAAGRARVLALPELQLRTAAFQ